MQEDQTKIVKALLRPRRAVKQISCAVRNRLVTVRQLQFDLRHAINTQVSDQTVRNRLRVKLLESQKTGQMRHLDNLPSYSQVRLQSKISELVER